MHKGLANNKAKGIISLIASIIAILGFLGIQNFSQLLSLVTAETGKIKSQVLSTPQNNNPEPTQTINLQPVRVSELTWPANISSPCDIIFLSGGYRDMRKDTPMESGFQAVIGFNDDGSVKFYFSSQGGTYRNYYSFSGTCTQNEKVALLKTQIPVIENQVRLYISGFTLKEPVIVQ